MNLDKETEQQIISSIKRYFSEERDEEIGDLKAMLYLDFIMKEIAPSIYNQAILDAQTFIQDKVNDMDGSCYKVPFTYWRKKR